MDTLGLSKVTSLFILTLIERDESSLMRLKLCVNCIGSVLNFI